MKKKFLIIILVVIILVLVFFIGKYFAGDFLFSEEEKQTNQVSIAEKVTTPKEKEFNTEMNIVTSLEDEISENTAWCGTFNLIWNDLKNELAKQDIVFEPQLKVVENLNQGTFNTEHLSEESYYKKYGIATLELKEEIKKAIQEKFDEKSDILDDFDWENASSEDYFLYSMLKKEFEFPQEFTELEKGKFGNYENVSYFGIDESSEGAIRNQVEVLYYNSKEDFAIKLLTKSNDEVILTKGNKAENFADSYVQIMKQQEEYDGNYEFSKEDRLQIPNIKFDLNEEIRELENKPFLFSNGEEYSINTALQTIQFELDKKGGKIKSEAGMMVNRTSIMMPEEPREFIIDDTFTIFLKEQDKELPYFVANIEDIANVQSDVKELQK